MGIPIVYNITMSGKRPYKITRPARGAISKSGLSTTKRSPKRAPTYKSTKIGRKSFILEAVPVGSSRGIPVSAGNANVPLKGILRNSIAGVNSNKFLSQNDPAVDVVITVGRVDPVTSARNEFNSRFGSSGSGVSRR